MPDANEINEYKERLLEIQRAGGEVGTLAEDIAAMEAGTYGASDLDVLPADDEPTAEAIAAETETFTVSTGGAS